jgi:hypothetical protein
MFVKLDGEFIGTRVFRWAQSGIKSDTKKRKVKVV